MRKGRWLAMADTLARGVHASPVVAQDGTDAPAPARRAPPQGKIVGGTPAGEGQFRSRFPFTAWTRAISLAGR